MKFALVCMFMFEMGNLSDHTICIVLQNMLGLYKQWDIFNISISKNEPVWSVMKLNAAYIIKNVGYLLQHCEVVQNR